jgi:hypothetical protein
MLPAGHCCHVDRHMWTYSDPIGYHLMGRTGCALFKKKKKFRFIIYLPPAGGFWSFYPLRPTPGFGSTRALYRPGGKIYISSRRGDIGLYLPGPRGKKNFRACRVSSRPARAPSDTHSHPGPPGHPPTHFFRLRLQPGIEPGTSTARNLCSTRLAALPQTCEKWLGELNYI